VLGLPVRRNKSFLEALFAIKQRNFGAGTYAPYGGKVEGDETFEEALIREFWQESKAECSTADIEKVGIIELYFCDHRNRPPLEIAVFLIHDWIGTLRDTSEMKNPQWFQQNSLPLGNMAPSNNIWIPKILDGKNIFAHVFYDPKSEKLFRAPEIMEYNRPFNGHRRQIIAGGFYYPCFVFPQKSAIFKRLL
jgi:8-oxo-dGTP pyrophosphatase MutT (NUDIX family)